MELHNVGPLSTFTHNLAHSSPAEMIHIVQSSPTLTHTTSHTHSDVPVPTLELPSASSTPFLVRSSCIWELPGDEMIGEGSTDEGDTDNEMLSPDRTAESFYSCQTSNTEEDGIVRSCTSTPSTCAHCRACSHSGENIWQQADEENKRGDDSRDNNVIVWSESSFLADNSGCSSDTIYMGLTEPWANIFQPHDREQEQLESNGPLPPHMLTSEVKVLEGEANTHLSGAGIDDKTNFGVKTLDGDKMGVCSMPHPRKAICSDAAGKAFQIKPEKEMGREVQQQCGANTCTEERQTRQTVSINPCPLTTKYPGTGKCPIRTP